MAITDKFMHASSGTRPEPTTLTAQKSIGASSLSADDLTGWATDTPTPFVLFQVDTMGKEVDGTRSDWVGIVVGNTITQLTLTAGTDNTYPTGSAVIAATTAEWGDRVVDGLLVSHDQDGTLKAGAVDNAAVLASNVVTSTAINDGAVGASKLSTSALTLGYAQITSTFSTSSTSPVQVTGLSASVTIPAGGRRIRISVTSRGLTNTAATPYMALSIWDGTVGSGTLLARQFVVAPFAGAFCNSLPVAVVTPAAGAKTYNIGFEVQGGTGSLTCSATEPAFIHVEAI